MNKIEEKAEEAWLDYEYRADGNLYSTCFKDGYIQGAKWALSHQWISVEDALPPTDGEYMTLYEQDSRQYVEIAPWRNGKYQGSQTILVRIGTVSITHWMPIPPLPGERKEESEYE